MEDCAVKFRTELCQVQCFTLILVSCTNTLLLRSGESQVHLSQATDFRAVNLDPGFS